MTSNTHLKSSSDDSGNTNMYVLLVHFSIGELYWLIHSCCEGDSGVHSRISSTHAYGRSQGNKADGHSPRTWVQLSPPPMDSPMPVDPAIRYGIISISSDEEDPEEDPKECSEERK
ncbi:unnamed protein product [Lupinus luteus]|uniref:Uncharacterized protein n=1 Tax=Lupinus luteus TaxID=3873 RepID=A0AAV1YFR4_LUPLU